VEQRTSGGVEKTADIPGQGLQLPLRVVGWGGAPNPRGSVRMPFRRRRIARPLLRITCVLASRGVPRAL
jgi:hypothetical protein